MTWGILSARVGCKDNVVRWVDLKRRYCRLIVDWVVGFVLCGS
jgi:hypothetical protein